jgi:cytochrome c oxidase subunit 1
MTSADLPLNASLPDSGHGHPDRWKWYDYFTFNVDHKVIGIQYLVSAFIFYLVGGFMAVLMRTELATPDSDFINPNLYNAFLTNHGTIMIFLWIIPAAIGGFGNYLIPLMIGARDMAFPKLNALAFWLIPPAGALLLASFFFGGAQAGWTSYPPLSEITANTAQTLWILVILLLGTSSILGSVNFLVTIWKMRVPSLGWGQLPLFCWAMVATAALALFSTPVLAAGMILLLFDINFGTSFYKPEGGVMWWCTSICSGSTLTRPFI